MQEHPFWSLASLPDAALLGGLADLVGSSRKVMARLIAHLAEVEHRRLHLDAGFGSMFAYCVGRLGLSEDEACRRIEVARLARQHPAIYPRLASGQLSLSVAALLRQYLSASTAPELLELVAGSSVEKARELLASRFPRPDVASVIRKLPERPAPRVLPFTGDEGMVISGEAASTAPSSSARVSAQPGSCSVPSARSRPIAIPLSKARYKIQLTADTELKEKLELARDLMRHTQPDGDLAPILSRALDLLIDQIMKRRFGARATRSARARVEETPATPPAPAPLNRDAPVNASEDREAKESPSVPTTAPTAASSTAASPTAASPTAASPTAASPTTAPTAASPTASSTAPSTTAPPVEHPHASIPRATRRNVAERDRLRCTWQGPDGTRCNTRAWLELDHRHPRARGGDATPENIRILCRAHNRRAAEQQYGRRHIDDCVTRAPSKEEAREPRPVDGGASPGAARTLTPSAPPVEHGRPSVS